MPVLQGVAKQGPQQGCGSRPRPSCLGYQQFTAAPPGLVETTSAVGFVRWHLMTATVPSAARQARNLAMVGDNVALGRLRRLTPPTGPPEHLPPTNHTTCGYDSAFVDPPLMVDRC
jgi:hypothetical protein